MAKIFTQADLNQVIGQAMAFTVALNERYLEQLDGPHISEGETSVFSYL